MTLNRERAAKACLAAAGVGGAICGIQLLAITGGFTGTNAPLSSVMTWGVIVFLITWMVAGLAFLIGLQAVGLPAATLLERRGEAAPLTTATLGSLMSAAAAGTFGGLAGGASGATTAAVFLLLPGAFAGFVFHRVAWRRKASAP